MDYPKYINGLNELNKEIQNNYEKNILLVFTATWCGPCQKLKSELISDDKNSGLQIKYQDKLIILYIDVDCDDNEELMEIYKVSGMPTQVLIKPTLNIKSNSINIEKINLIVGYDMIKLMMALEKM
tara:strand:+ start:181 stop:558 length:378 start_codon:yes stop_codon:yes gene_type:complete